jgi:hypothetical protein
VDEERDGKEAAGLRTSERAFLDDPQLSRAIRGEVSAQPGSLYCISV